ncbi:hypothetical protein [Actinotalea solisilvae]|uniref:hypothetical protein n=1 Tax=Actinotalea solisilvae TaxID=2072922 RepID=UPI0018F188B0|nr:hypothetical protein [Actinotalea solisilvae]
MHAATEAIGLLASLSSFLLWIPQGLRVWRGRHDPAALRGVAPSTQVIALAGGLLWVVYAVLLDSFWIGAPVVVSGPIAAVTLVVLARGRRAERAAAAAPSSDAGAALVAAAQTSSSQPAAEQVALAA